MELLKRLTETVAPSGSEERICELIQKEIAPHVDEVYTDALGNLIAHKKGAGKKLMLAVHTDEIGVIVTFIEENGFLRFHGVGGVSVQASIGARVKFLNGTTGVVFYEAKRDVKNLKLNDLYIDIGAKSQKEAEEMVSIGDTAGFVGEFIQQGDVVISKALDDRAGCFVLIEAVKRAKNCPNDLYAVFTVQEELGLRGAKVSAFGVAPDMGIAIDVTDTGDTPGAKPIAVKLGGGAAIKVRDSRILAHKKVRELLVDLAKERQIPYQLEVLQRGGTDAGAISLTRSGVPAGALSIPVRYIHSPSEMASLSDIDSCIKLLTAVIETKID